MADTDDRSIGELIDSVPWRRLTTAYDFATEAPALLHAQVGATGLDPAFDDWLFSAVTHQGTPYSGTAPVLWLLRRIVDARPGHPALGLCLSAVAVCAAAINRAETRTEDRGTDGDDARAPRLYRSPDGDPLWASATPPGYAPPPKTDGRVHDDYFRAAVADVDTLKACVLEWHATIARCLTERSPLDEALEAGSAVVQLWPTGPVADAMVTVVRDRKLAVDDRAGALYALSRAGRSVADLVDPRERALQFAMALGQPGGAGHLQVLIDALGDLAWLSTTFPDGLPGAEAWLIPVLVVAVLDQTPVTDAGTSLVDALVGVLSRPSGPLGATHEWGPVLAWAFPDRVQKGVVQAVPLPESVNPLQARLLTALVGNDRVWAPKSGNDSLALGRVGLPHDRAAVAALLALS